MCVQIERHTNAFIEVRRKNDLVDRAKIPEGHLDLRALCALQSVQSHAYPPELCAGPVDEKNDAIFFGQTESRTQNGQHAITPRPIDHAFAIRFQDHARTVEVEGPEQEHGVSIRHQRRRLFFSASFDRTPL